MRSVSIIQLLTQLKHSYEVARPENPMMVRAAILTQSCAKKKGNDCT